MKFHLMSNTLCSPSCGPIRSLKCVLPSGLPCDSSDSFCCMFWLSETKFTNFLKLNPPSARICCTTHKLNQHHSHHNLHHQHKLTWGGYTVEYLSMWCLIVVLSRNGLDDTLNTTLKVTISGTCLSTLSTHRKRSTSWFSGATAIIKKVFSISAATTTLWPLLLCVHRILTLCPLYFVQTWALHTNNHCQMP